MAGMSGISGVIATGQAYRKALDFGWTQELEDIIINSKDPSWAYYFARYVNKANITRLEQAVIDSGEPRWIYLFANDIYGANIPRLEQAVIDSGNLQYAFYFAHDVRGANISDLIDFVLINEPWRIKELFKLSPSLRRKYELGEIRKQIRGILE